MLRLHPWLAAVAGDGADAPSQAPYRRSGANPRGAAAARGSKHRAHHPGGGEGQRAVPERPHGSPGGADPRRQARSRQRRASRPRGRPRQSPCARRDQEQDGVGPNGSWYFAQSFGENRSKRYDFILLVGERHPETVCKDDGTGGRYALSLLSYADAERLTGTHVSQLGISGGYKQFPASITFAFCAWGQLSALPIYDIFKAAVLAFIYSWTTRLGAWGSNDIVFFRLIGFLNVLRVIVECHIVTALSHLIDAARTQPHRYTAKKKTPTLLLT